MYFSVSFNYLVSSNGSFNSFDRAMNSTIVRPSLPLHTEHCNLPIKKSLMAVPHENELKFVPPVN